MTNLFSNNQDLGGNRKETMEEGEETVATKEKTTLVAKSKIPTDIQKAIDIEKLNKRQWSQVQSKEFSIRKGAVDFVVEQTFN